MPTGAAITTMANTFTTSQTVTGNLILSGGIQFGAGSLQSTAPSSSGSGGTCTPPSQVSSASPVVPAGYTALGAVTAGNVWFPITLMPTARFDLAAAMANGKVYAVGGQTNSAVIGALEIYDPKENAWSAGTAMPTARATLAAAAVNAAMYAIGGVEVNNSPD